MLSQFAYGKIRHMDGSDNEETTRLIIRKIGDLQADLAKFIATLNLLSPMQIDQLARTNRRLLFVLIGIDIAVIVLLAVHLSFSAGLLGR